VPTIDPMTDVPLSTVSRPARTACPKRAAPPARAGRRVLVTGVDDDVGAELLGQLKLLVGDVDRRDRAAEVLGLLHGQVAQATDAGYEHQVIRPDVADLAQGPARIAHQHVDRLEHR